MVLLLLCESGVLVGFSYIQKDFATALTNHDREGFYKGILHYFFMILISAPVFATSKYFQDRLSIECRSWLTFKLCTSYFADTAFYHLKVEDDVSANVQTRQSIDNPDQRIADDVKNFSMSVVTVAVLLFGKFVRVLSFMSVLYSISPMLVRTHYVPLTPWSAALNFRFCLF
jgi:putative ATP-binding cassette transporter